MVSTWEKKSMISRYNQALSDQLTWDLLLFTGGQKKNHPVHLYCTHYWIILTSLPTTCSTVVHAPHLTHHWHYAGDYGRGSPPWPPWLDSYSYNLSINSCSRTLPEKPTSTARAPSSPAMPYLASFSLAITWVSRWGEETTDGMD